VTWPVTLCNSTSIAAPATCGRAAANTAGSPCSVAVSEALSRLRGGGILMGRRYPVGQSPTFQ
jgi:hypothetical protein